MYGVAAGAVQVSHERPSGMTPGPVLAGNGFEVR
jgi:hypothetical protein